MNGCVYLRIPQSPFDFSLIAIMQYQSSPDPAQVMIFTSTTYTSCQDICHPWISNEKIFIGDFVAEKLAVDSQQCYSRSSLHSLFWVGASCPLSLPYFPTCLPG